MTLNRRQRGALNVSCGIAHRAILLLTALLEVCARSGAPPAVSELASLHEQLAAYQERLDALVAAFELAPEVRDVRPAVLEHLYRLGDALSPDVVDELRGYGALDPADERWLRQAVAELTIRVKKMLQTAAALAPAPHPD